MEHILHARTHTHVYKREDISGPCRLFTTCADTLTHLTHTHKHMRARTYIRVCAIIRVRITKTLSIQLRVQSMQCICIYPQCTIHMRGSPLLTCNKVQSALIFFHAPLVAHCIGWDRAVLLLGGYFTLLLLLFGFGCAGVFFRCCCCCILFCDGWKDGRLAYIHITHVCNVAQSRREKT